MINFNDLKVGSQILFLDPITKQQTVAVCISKNDDDADLLTEYGSIYLQEKNLEETVKSFNIELIDETHEKWQVVDSKVFDFFSKLDDLEEKYKNGETEETEHEFLQLLEQLGDEFDNQI